MIRRDKFEHAAHSGLRRQGALTHGETLVFRKRSF
jgi:hypothetical protein